MHSERPQGSGGDVIVLTGPPGAGKSTVAALLADRFSPGVHLHTDDFWHYIRRGRIAPYLSEAHHQNRVVIDVVVQAAFTFAAGGYHVVVDGIVGPWFVPPFRRAGHGTGIALHYVVLRPDEASTLRRATDRGHDALVDPGLLRELYRQFSDLGPLEPHAVDSTTLSAEQTAAVVLDAVHDGRYVLRGKGSGTG